MIVVVDSNQFYGDPLMTGREFGIILGQHRRGELTVTIPEVVAREVPKLFQEQYTAARDRYASGTQNLAKLGYDAPVSSLPDSDDAATAFVQQFREQLVNLNIDVPGLPSVSLSDLVDDSIAERRPWQPKSRGFRDALIWRTVVELALIDEVILVSKNADDFAVSSKQPSLLHPRLLDDAIALGHGPDRIRLVPTLEEFISQFVPVADQTLLAAQNRLAVDHSFEQLLTDEVEAALYRFEAGIGDQITVVASENADIEQLSVADVAVSDVAITSAYEGEEEGSVFLEIETHAVLHFTFITDISGAEWLIEEGADVEIELWEASFAQGRTYARYLQVTFWADYEPQTGALGELEQAAASDDQPAEP